MFRKLLVPLAASALLAGCITTAPYGYQGDERGDYYYGSPSVDYRYDGYSGYGGGYPGYGYPGYGNGSSYYGPYRPGISIYGTYGYPGYGYGGYGYGGYSPYSGYGYGYPGYGYPTTHVHHHHQPPPTPVTGTEPPPQPVNRPDGGTWRDVDGLRRRRLGGDDDGGIAGPGPTPSQPITVERPMPTFERRPVFEPRPAFSGDGGDRGSSQREPMRREPIRERRRDSEDPTP